MTALARNYKGQRKRRRFRIGEEVVSVMHVEGIVSKTSTEINCFCKEDGKGW
jgi:hypothetical protein